MDVIDYCQRCCSANETNGPARRGQTPESAQRAGRRTHFDVEDEVMDLAFAFFEVPS